jgi:molecular chaperone Hsp33
MSNYVQRFLLENLDIRGAIVHLDSVWQEILAGRNYPDPVTHLLGEMSAVTLLLSENLKQTGRLTIQLTGNGPVSMLVLDCTENLQLRGMAKCARQIETDSVPELLGHGQLILTLDMLSMRETYQSIVPLNGGTIAEIFEHYFNKSEQLQTRMFLIATGSAIFGLLLQKLPDADLLDPDGWTRAEALAATIHEHPLFELPVEEILVRLFYQETIRIFDARHVQYGCQANPAKIYAMLRSLGREEVDAILQEFGEVVIHDDICNREYRLDALAVDAVFRDAGPTIH